MARRHARALNKVAEEVRRASERRSASQSSELNLPPGQHKLPGYETRTKNPKLPSEGLFDEDQNFMNEFDFEDVKVEIEVARLRDEARAEGLLAAPDAGPQLSPAQKRVRRRRLSGVARDVRRASEERSASRVRAALPPELRMTSGNAGASSENDDEKRRDSRKASGM